jgi:flagellar hook-basal body complex protein FliE
MNIESLAAVGAIDTLSDSSVLEIKPDVNKGVSFSEVISEYYTQVNDQINQADFNLREFAVGNTTNIHDLLISIEKAKTSFELGLQVRNRLMEGYQELMRMQV